MLLVDYYNSYGIYGMYGTGMVRKGHSCDNDKGLDAFRTKNIGKFAIQSQVIVIT